MEIVKNRFGLDRSVERIDFERVMVMGESMVTKREKKRGALNSFEFEGGPLYVVGSKIAFENAFWKIKAVKENVQRNGLTSITLTVSPVY